MQIAHFGWIGEFEGELGNTGLQLHRSWTYIEFSKKYSNVLTNKYKIALSHSKDKNSWLYIAPSFQIIIIITVIWYRGTSEYIWKSFETNQDAKLILKSSERNKTKIII